MSSARAGHAAVLLGNGSILVIGGLDSPPGATETAGERRPPQPVTKHCWMIEKQLDTNQ